MRPQRRGPSLALFASRLALALGPPALAAARLALVATPPALVAPGCRPSSDGEDGQREAPSPGPASPAPSSSAPGGPPAPSAPAPGPPPAPAPMPAPSPPPGPSSSAPLPAPGAPAGPAGELLALVNQARAEARACGGQPFEPAPPLRWDARLGEAAAAHSGDMAARDYFDHASPEGAGPAERLTERGYTFSTLGENIAAGSNTPAEAMSTWLGSAGHCENIMNPAFRDFGAGRAEGGPFGVYWTQVFASPR